MARELQEHNGAEGDLEADYQAASDHLNLVQTALRQQEKIERYEADLDELQIRLEEQNEVVAEAVDRQEENEARAEAAELEVDELKSQLADYQQALDVQQTRAIQYNQALQALERAKALCHLPDLTPESADEWLETFQAKEQEATEKMLSLEQKMSVAQTAHSQFEQAYQLVAAINGPLARNEAWDVARELLRDGVNQRHQAEQAQGLRSRLNELEQRLREQQDAERQLAEFCKRQGKRYDIDDLEMLHQELEARIASLADSVSNAQEQRMALRQELEQLQSRTQTLMRRAPVWLAAQNSLNQLCEQAASSLRPARRSPNTCSSCWSVNERLSLNVTRSAPASAPSTKKSSVSASRAVRKIRASTPWRNGSAAFCCPRSTMMLASTMRRTSPRCMVRRAMRSWFRICRG